MTKTSGHRNNSGRRKISFVLVLGATFQVHHWEGIEAGQLCLWSQGHVAVAVPMAAAGKAGSDQSGAGLQTSKACLPLVVTYFLQPVTQDGAGSWRPSAPAGNP